MPAAPSELWRISDFQELNGEGGLHYAARWHTAGHPIVYLAESPAGALIEILVHLELDESDLPHPYSLLRVSVSGTPQMEILTVAEGDAWKQELTKTRAIGDEWLASRRSVLARVPSAMLPNTYNYLLNPEHSEVSRFQVAEVITANLDTRFIRKGPS